MEISKLTILENDKVLITIDKKEMLLDNGIIDLSDQLIRLSFSISQKKIFTIESLFYLEVKSAKQQAILKEVRSYKDINDSIISTEFLSNLVVFDFQRVNIHMKNELNNIKKL